MSGSLLLNNANLGSELQSLLMCDGIVPGAEPSYQVAKTIYLYHPLGGKLAEAPIELAQSQQRKIAVQEGPEERLAEAFAAEWERVGADHYIFTTATVARVYGISSLIMGAVGVNAGEPIDPFKFPDLDLFFNCLDPLNTAGSLVLDQNPNSPNFQRPTTITVAGTAYHPSRAVVFLNGPPIYIAYTSSAFGFVGRSVYQRALFPLKTYVNLVQAVNLLAVKLGVIVAKMKQGGTIADAIMQRAAAQKREFIKEAATGNVLSISTEEDIETLDLQNADKVLETALKKNLEMIASAAPMPAKLLNQETFAEGFGEGTEDAKVIVRYVNRIRAELAPLYRFFDKIVQHRAWSPIFYRAIQNDFPEYRDVPYEAAFYQWQNSFSAEWPSLIEEPDSEKVKVSETKLRAITSMVEVFLPNTDPDNKARVLQWAADNLNAEKQMFTAPLELDWEALAAYEPAAAGGVPGQDAPEADAPGQAEPAAPQPEGLARGDSADLVRMDKDGSLSADQHWITTKTASHILLDGEGTVVAGAGGALTGRSLSSFGGSEKSSKTPSLGLGFGKGTAPAHRVVDPAPTPQQEGLGLAEPSKQAARPAHHAEAEIRAILGGNASAEQVAKLAALFGSSRPAAPVARPQKAWTPTGTEIEARPEVVDLGDLTTSNDDDGKVNQAFPQHLQPRDRSTAASQSQIRSLAGRLNPELLAPSPLTSSGAPIVGPDGVVESGNGRTMALRKVLTDPAFAEQRKRYVDHLAEQGHDVSGMKNPVLVMRRTSPMTDAQRRQFVVEANERTTLGMGAAEQAKSDADRAGANIDKWQGSDAGSASNAAFARGFMSTMSPEERGAMLDKDGSLSADGERRIQSAVTAHAYGESFGPILDKFLGGTNDGMKAIANGMAEAAGPWAQLRKAAAAGTIPPHLDITKDLAAAVETVARARQLGRPVKELLDQTDLDRAPLSPVAHSLLSAFYQNDSMKRPASKDAVAGVLSRYAEAASKVSPAPDMFGTPPASSGHVLKDALANPSRHDAAEFCQDAADDAEFYAAHGMAGDTETQQDSSNA